MKSALRLIQLVAAESLPVRGAWIEIMLWVSTGMRVASLPVRGAWIEIQSASRRG